MSKLNSNEIKNLVNKAVEEYEDGTVGTYDCVEFYIEDNGLDHLDVDEIIEEYDKLEALSCGIPLSVINGEKKLSDCFSKDYINYKTNRG